MRAGMAAEGGTRAYGSAASGEPSAAPGGPPPLVLVGLAVAGLVACDAPAEEERGPVGEEVRPSYSLRLDSESSDPELFHLVEDDDGVRVQTGPAGIAYRDDDDVPAGDFRVEATFLQYDAPPGYREAFGLFVGGRDLAGPDLEYTYLLVRTTGDVLVKRRVGETTETILDWTPHESVASVAAEGDRPLNALAIEVAGDETRFEVNGVVVHSMETARARPHGIAGLRVNHRLDVRIDDWLLTGTGPGS